MQTPVFNPVSTSGRKCSLCKKTGHNISVCDDADSHHLLQMNETVFSTLLFERLRSNDEQMHSREYNDFIITLSHTKINLLKFFVSKYGGYASLNTKMKLIAMYIFHLIRRFVVRNIDIYSNVSRRHMLILMAERSYWLYIGSGNTVAAAERMYYERIRNIDDDSVDNNNNKLPIKIELNPYDIVEDFTCDICYEPQSGSNKVVYDCSHSFCGNCVKTSLEICMNNNTRHSCAMCRNTFKTIHITSGDLETSFKQLCVTETDI